MRVEALHLLAQVAPLADAMTALNLASRRPCPFSTFEYLEHFLRFDEYGASESELLFLAAFEGDALVGYLPLRKHRTQTFGLPFTRIGVMISHDTDRPHLVAKPDDELTCAKAMQSHLLEREPGWDVVDVAMQDADSPLLRQPLRGGAFVHARTTETMPNTTVPLGDPSFERYLARLSSGHRKNSGRLARRLFEAGVVEYVRCDDPRGGAAMLELYLDVERRSWKFNAGAGVARSGQRLAKFRDLATRGGPFVVGLEALLLDGVAIAAIISGSYAGVRHGLETCFDRGYEALGAGHFLTLLTLAHAVEAGERAYNFNGNYAYYKASLGGVVTPTQALQLYRVGSAPWLRARGGELLRWLKPPANADAARFNPDRRRAEQATDGAPHDGTAKTPLPTAAERERERTLVRRTLGALQAQQIAFQRLSPAELARRLPFSLHPAAA